MCLTQNPRPRSRKPSPLPWQASRWIRHWPHRVRLKNRRRHGNVTVAPRMPIGLGGCFVMATLATRSASSAGEILRQSQAIWPLRQKQAMRLTPHGQQEQRILRTQCQGPISRCFCNRCVETSYLECPKCGLVTHRQSPLVHTRGSVLTRRYRHSVSHQGDDSLQSNTPFIDLSKFWLVFLRQVLVSVVGYHISTDLLASSSRK